ncbi:MAG: hypothetical protein ABIA76_05100 [Candidatus Diapherotrites archaeon]
MKVKKIEILVQSRKKITNDVVETFEAIKKGRKVKKKERLVFESVEMFRKMITPERLRLLKLIREKKPKSIRQLSKIAKRDYGNLYRDVKLLESMDLIEINKEEVKVEFDEMKISVPLEAVA